VPGEVQAPGTIRDGADAVLPAEARHEVAAGIPDRADAELFHQLDHVAPKTSLIRGRMPRLVDSGVDVAPQVLHEAAEQAAADLAHGGGGGQTGGRHIASFWFCRTGI
jgi:hypothetical protein